MQNRFLLVVGLFLFLGNKVEAQINKCIVKDAQTHEPLSYVSVFSKDFNYNCIANEHGEFEVDLSLFIKTDSLFISRIGYEKMVISYSEFKKSGSVFFLKTIPNDLGNVTIFSTKLSWGEIMFRALQTVNLKSQTSFESEVYRKVSFKKNGIEQLNFTLKGFGHDEGFDANQLINNRNAYSWFVYNAINFTAKANVNFKDYDGSIISGDTYFETRVIKFLLPLSIKYYKYSLEGIELMDKDTVFKISAVPNPEYIHELKVIDRKLFNSFYSFLFAAKTYYIKHRTFEFVRIKFDNTLSRKVESNDFILKSSSGYCDFYTSNGSIHPTVISMQHSYMNNQDQYVRSDVILFSNIKKIILTNEDLVNKYKLRDLKGTFPGRQAYADSKNYYNPQSFIYVYGIKF